MNVLASSHLAAAGFSGLCYLQQDRIAVISSSIEAKIVTDLVRGLIFLHL